MLDDFVKTHLLQLVLQLLERGLHVDHFSGLRGIRRVSSILEMIIWLGTCES